MADSVITVVIRALKFAAFFVVGGETFESLVYGREFHGKLGSQFPGIRPFSPLIWVQLSDFDRAFDKIAKDE